MIRASSKNKANCQIQLINHDCILPNPNQPRVRFDYSELEGLASSIRTSGLLQPINVRPLEGGKFELISGERRLRAARMVGRVSRKVLPKLFCSAYLRGALKAAVYLKEWTAGAAHSRYFKTPKRAETPAIKGL